MKNMDIIYVDKKVVQQIKATICTQSMESGGILGIKDGVVSVFYEDKNADVSYGSYQPDIVSCEKVINDEWSKSDVSFCGFVHTHRMDMKPSEADIQYYRTILESMRDIGYDQAVYLFIADCKAQENNFLYAYIGHYDEQNRFSACPVTIIVK